MDVAEKKMADAIAIRSDDLREGFFLYERNPIQCGDADIKRRVMHEKINLFLGGGCQLLLKPFKPGLTVPALMVAGLVGIKIDKAPCGQILNRLNKSVFIKRVIREPLPEHIPVIVVADQKPKGDLKLIEMTL